MNQTVALHRDEWELLFNSSSLVAIDCFATWCGPCQVTSPFLDRLAREYEGRATVVKLDVDREKEVVKQLGIRSIPSVLILKEGQLVETIVGVAPYEKFSQALDRYL
ncbi:MAG: thioredoxin domain-containing protein [Geitlerinemataceae cyanobacterium]